MTKLVFAATLENPRIQGAAISQAPNVTLTHSSHERNADSVTTPVQMRRKARSGPANNLA